MRPTTRDLGLRLMGVLGAMFDDPKTAFGAVPAGVSLAMTYHCSKDNEGMFTFALGTVERGNAFLVPVGHKVADMRVEAHGRAAIGFLTNVKAVVELGLPTMDHDAVTEYEPHEVQKMAQDIMFHLCSAT